MKENFVPFEQALNFKEIRFDEECMSFYNQSGSLNLSRIDSFDWVIRNSNSRVVKLKYVSAPLWQQAFDWFREKHGLMNHLTTHLNTWGEDGALEKSYGYRIMFNKDGWKCEVWEKLSRFDTYEEARLECLKKLIKLVEIIRL